MVRGGLRSATKLRARLLALLGRRRSLKRDSPLLQPGLWVAERRVAYHWRAPSEMRARITGEPVRRTRREGTSLRRVARLLPSIVWIRPQPPPPDYPDHGGRYTIRLPPGYSPERVLFDTSRRKVLRLVRGRPDVHRTQVPTRMSPHVPVVGSETLEGGRAFLEDLVDGPSFAELTDAGRRLQVVKELLTAYAGLAGAEREGSTAPLLSAAIDTANSVSLPPRLDGWLQRFGPELLERAGCWPLVPSHSDLTGTNVVLRDGRPVLIDLEWAGYYPYFYDPVSLILREAAEERRPDLLTALLEGDLQHDLRALCQAASCSVEPPRTLLVAAALIRCHCLARAGGTVDRVRYLRYLERTWAPLDPYFPTASVE
jgi:hypothetical protein